MAERKKVVTFIRAVYKCMNNCKPAQAINKSMYNDND